MVAPEKILEVMIDEKYQACFSENRVYLNQHLNGAVESETGEILGTFQLSFIQYLTYTGGMRAQVEAVRVRKDQRGSGLGTLMFDWIIRYSKENGAHLLQLTTDKRRPEAISFYEKLGFTSSHEG
ncbi:MAG: GNAT family N-acetyltransferase [Saprospiraceae bacterium]